MSGFVEGEVAAPGAGGRSCHTLLDFTCHLSFSRCARRGAQTAFLHLE
jgi:hypothetical protein